MSGIHAIIALFASAQTQQQLELPHHSSAQCYLQHEALFRSGSYFLPDTNLLCGLSKFAAAQLQCRELERFLQQPHCSTAAGAELPESSYAESTNGLLQFGTSLTV